MKVSIIGQGYVGLSLALAIERAGHKVIGFDIDTNLIESLKANKSHVETVNDNELVLARNYLPTSDPTDLSESDVVIIAVPTPIDSNNKPQLDNLINASQLAAKNLSKSALVINESTSFPGTLRNLVMEIFNNTSDLVHSFAASPERVDPGNKHWNQSNTPRLVSGIDATSTRKAAEFYSSFCNEVIIVSSPEIAEAAKLFENTFRHINIALVNEFAKICNGLNLDVHDVLNASATKPFGFMKFTPSLGVGGHCIPVDPHYLKMSAVNAGVKTEFIDLATYMNEDMSSYVVERIKSDLGLLKEKKILVHGLAYKPNVSDVRESPSLKLIKKLKLNGARVHWFDSKIENLVIENRVSNFNEKYDCAVIAVVHENDSISELIKCASYVFDCTGKFKEYPGI